MDKRFDYMDEGKLTKFTPLVRELTDKVQGEDLAYIKNLLYWMNSYFEPSPEGQEREKLLYSVYLNRTVDGVIKSKFCIACSERAYVFATLCRAKGIPAKFIQTISLNWLKRESDQNMQQHAFVEVFVDNDWILTDPSRALLIFRKEGWKQFGHVFFTEGLDSQDCMDGKGRYYSWKTLNEMKADVLKFKQERNKIS